MQPPKPHFVTCPTCARLVAWSSEQRWRPFCSERCKLIDLGSWFGECNRIPCDEQIAAAGERDFRHQKT